jgi:hypothetical protein
MKVYLSKYRYHWISPYSILEKIFFWREIDYDEPIIDRLSNLLQPFCVGIQKVLDTVHPKIDYVKVDKWDTWNMDATLSQIILPLLKQLKATKDGSPHVDDEDVPEGLNLRSTEAPVKENEWDTDDNWHKRWDWVLAEMIWTFEQLTTDWDSQYHTGEVDRVSTPCAWDENGKPTMYSWDKGPNDTSHFDVEGYTKHNDRISKGLILFGKYYRGLWN